MYHSLQIRAVPGHHGAHDPDQDEAVPTGGADDAAPGRPGLQAGDEVQEQDGGVPDRLGDGEQPPAGAARLRGCHQSYQVSDGVECCAVLRSL